MKNNKGFTVIEVAVSFVLVATISLVLLQLVLSLKEVYLTGDVKTTLLNKQGIMTKHIYDDLNNKDLSGVTSCGVSCLTFNYGDHTSKNLLVDPGNKTITYGDYTLQIDNASYFDKITVDIYQNPTTSVDKDDSILIIDIPVKSKLLNDENFGFHIIKTFNQGTTTIDIETDLLTTPITLAGINTNLYIVPNKANNSLIESIFAKVYHQTSGNYFSSSFDNFIKSNDTNKFSTLTSLEAFRMKNSVDTIKNDLKTSFDYNDKEKALIDQTYQNGYFAFILTYNGASLGSGNYYWWIQTSNIAKKEDLEGFYVSFANGVGPNGLTYNKTGNAWSSIVGKTTNIGIKEGGSLLDLEGNTANSADLYVDAREYLCKYSMSKVMYNNTNIKALTLSDGTPLCPSSSEENNNEPSEPDSTPTVTITNKSVTSVEVGSTLTLQATKANTDSEITWTSSDTSAATVENGVVTGVSVGNTTITASAGGVSDTISIAVITNGPNKVNAKSGETHKGIIYMNPTDLTATCYGSNSVSTTGTKTGCMKFYIYDDSGDTYKMILDHNTTARIAYNTTAPYVEYEQSSIKTQLEADTAGWVGSPRLITADEIAAITENTTFDGSYDTIFYFGSNNNIDYSWQSNEQKARQRSFHWLFDYIVQCTDYGCNIAESSAGGYWTSSVVTTGPYYVWAVGGTGGIHNDLVTTDRHDGIRPVITLSKSLFDQS